MNDDNKKTVEDQELAEMIASMKGNSGQVATKQAQNNPVKDFKVPTPPPKPAVPDSAVTPPPLPPQQPSMDDGRLPVDHAPVKPSPTPPLAPEPPEPPKPSTEIKNPVAANGSNSDLASIKQSAIQALRPLVNQLNLPAEEKFDTLLLLIRSTDDKSLIQPAYEAVQQITDDTKKAQALLDIVKEIDFFESLNK